MLTNFTPRVLLSLVRSGRVTELFEKGLMTADEHARLLKQVSKAKPQENHDGNF